MKQQRATTEPLTANGPRKLLTDLCHLVAERAATEVDIRTRFEQRGDDARRKHQESLQANNDRYEEEKVQAQRDLAASRHALVERFETDYGAAEKQYKDVRAHVLSQFDADDEEARQNLQEASWEVSAVAEAGKDGSTLELKEIMEELDRCRRELQEIHEQAVAVLQQRWQWRDYPKPSPAKPSDDPLRLVVESVPRAKEQLRNLSNLAVPRLFEGAQPLGVFLAIWFVSIVPSGFALGWLHWAWIPVSILVAIVVTVALGTWLYHLARRQSTEAYHALEQTLADAEAARPRAIEAAQRACRCQAEKIARCRNEDLKKADHDFSSAQQELRTRKENDLQQADRHYPAMLTEITARRDRELEQADKQYAERLAQIEETYQAENRRIEELFARTMEESQQSFAQEREAMIERWRTGIEQFHASVDAINDECNRRFPDWDATDWQRWTPAADGPPAIRFGTHEVSLGRIENGLPQDEALKPAKTEFTVPALLPFPYRPLLLLKAEGEGRDVAVKVLQSAMLRMLTSIPPGKVRFTIVDPVGLGENFSAFMHLADYDEQLVASRIWTDNAHIEQRLSDLTEHMENVIQVYLRNEFQSIQEYNRFAGEMAEPYRVLVIANFPANFSETAAQRLKSIVASGARCGVYTLLSVDTKLRLPRHFDLADLEPHARILTWTDGRFVWKHSDYGKMELCFPDPPRSEQFTEIVRSVGRELKDVDRVEVPFQCVAPEEEQRWTADSRGGIDVPLGRAGAMKLQHLGLGKGTAQHVLVSGKTGSGKSTLLHALITNLALRYSPDEIELYLVDFKKGVEFKAYASGELAHARVIAIESEREFGLSVLEHLDAELKRRGDMFRKLGVQDLRAYRAAQAEARLPRVLLIIDEFQELFVEDDRIAQDAALLLDRLVRQGRAFGIHVLLGSQTLGGAYSLARSTIGQMAVRIALQCSESDAHLILSEDNTAALLTRPGEAIYNDANGLYEGNHPFQVVWLPDFQRDRYLEQLRELARARKVDVKPPIVFEGNVPADPGENRLLGDLLAAPSWPKPSHIAHGWLGSAVAIKDPTSATFIRQSGSNLLLVGHREEAALGVLTACLIALAAQHAPSTGGKTATGPRFYVLDGIRPDAPEAGFWNRVAPVLPHAVKIATPREAAGVIAEVDAEVARREEDGDEQSPPIYLIGFNVGRFRDLRKAEDDFSFSRSDENQPPSPAKQFAHILREGPVFGVHTLLWCDTYNNVSRSLDRQSLRDVEMRVLFHMNATDSSNLIDSPAASRLGIHRALFYDEGQGLLEKFRPYGLPSDEWLARVAEQFQRRSAKKGSRKGNAP